MAHEHPVVDADKHFLIDPVTRVVKNSESKKTTLVQNDHNSERLSFEVDRYIEGHDMLESANVRIHYDNIGTNRLKNSGVYEVDDIQPNPEDSTKVIFTWLISQNCTSLVGALNFSITFECETDGVVEYRWSTVLNTTDVYISEGLDNSGAVASTYVDILTKWKNELYSIVYTYPTFAEVCRWEDDNLDDEYRIGYFVTAEESDITEEVLMVKATAGSDIRGVTMESPGFAANAGDYKFDEKGELLPQYDYVGFSGFIPIIDNGLCSVNGWCKCGDNGTAIPADGATGFRVIERVDETHVLILVEPQGSIATLIEKDTQIVNALTEHVNDKSNPHGVTAKQVGAAEAATHNLRTYTSLTQIGLTAGSETILDIIKNIPTYSELMFTMSKEGYNYSEYPGTYGICKVCRGSDPRVSLEFAFITNSGITTPRRYVGSGISDGNNSNWSGWFAVFNEAYLPKTGDMGVSNPNLLHNWYFPNPVNRNGLSEYINQTTAWTTTMDRFRCSYANITLKDDCVNYSVEPVAQYKRVNQTIYAKLYSGQTYTLSMLAKINSVSGTSMFRLCSSAYGNVAGCPSLLLKKNETDDYALFTITVTPSVDQDSFGFEILTYNTTSDTIDIDIKAMKLELGTQQTLAHQDANGNWVLNEIPDYAEQMAICMQYDKTTGAYTGIQASDVGAFPNGAGSGVINGTTTSPFNIPPGHYSVEGISTAYNWPVDDTTNLNGTLLVFGRLNQPSTNKGYRVYVYFDNKDRFYYACEWWGNTPKWKNVFTADGSVAMSGDTLWLKDKTARVLGNKDLIRIETYCEASNDNNRRALWVGSSSNASSTNAEDSIRLFDIVNGVQKTYRIYGEHNITCGTSDITAGTTALTTGCYYDVYK